MSHERDEVQHKLIHSGELLVGNLSRKIFRIGCCRMTESVDGSVVSLGKEKIAATQQLLLQNPESEAVTQQLEQGRAAPAPHRVGRLRNAGWQGEAVTHVGEHEVHYY